MGCRSYAKLCSPSNSPDLNPIEKLIKDLLQKHKKPKNQQEMAATIQAVWDEVSLEQIQDLIANMPSRMQAVISTSGEALDGS